MADEKVTETPKETILTTKEPEKPTPEKTLFPTVEEAKAAAIKELETKQAAEKAAAEKVAADAAALKKAEEEKPKPKETVADPTKATPSPTDYTLNLPENSVLTKEDLDAALKEAKASGLSEEEAKEMLQERDQVAQTAVTRLQQKQEQDLKTMVAKWKEDVKNDPEIGGEKLQETAIKASRAFRAVASPAMIDFVNKTGYGEHPEMVRMMLKVYDLIGEDRFIRGSTSVTNNVPTTMEEKAKKLFGNPIKEAAV